MKRLFVTGASGFIGHHLLRRLSPDQYQRVYCLTRSEPPLEISQMENVEVIRGSLTDVERYREILEQVDAVIHLAAVTGKARPDAYFRVNTEGTRILIKQCQEAGVRRFMHVSTIAAKFPNLSQYPYARSKLEAEEIVRSSNLRYTIIRPTIVVGKGATIWHRLQQMASGPLIPVPGDGSVQIQPIHVDDLVDSILALLDQDGFYNETLELGGPEVLTIEELLRRIHQHVNGVSGHVVHVPLKVVLPVLASVEKVLYPILPVTAGQLSSFRYDGVAAPNALTDRHASEFKDVSEMILSMNGQSHSPADDDLDHECRIFCRYLVGQEPSNYVLENYRRGNVTHGLDQQLQENGIERLLIKMAGRGPFFTWLADIYTRIFLPYSVIRKKLILLLAILEICGTTHSLFISRTAESRKRFYIRLLKDGLVFVLALLLATTLFRTLHLLHRLRPQQQQTKLEPEKRIRRKSFEVMVESGTWEK